MELYPARKLNLVGFSLSGNVVLKYLGEGRSLPANLNAALAVNPPIDLKVASRQISEGKWASLFNPYYLRLMNRQVQAMSKSYPQTILPAFKPKNIWEFDVSYTAPAFGYPSAEAYYEACSSTQFLGNIDVPTTILCSRDDPFIPPELFEKAHWSGKVQYLNPEQGGHMGYIARRKTPLGDRRWMDFICVQWAKSVYPD